jgi:hypothetical protein
MAGIDDAANLEVGHDVWYVRSLVRWFFKILNDDTKMNGVVTRRGPHHHRSNPNQKKAVL